MGFMDVLFGETEKISPTDIRSGNQMTWFNSLLGGAGPKALEYFQTAGDPFPSSVVQPSPTSGFQKELFGNIPGMFDKEPYTQGPLFQQSVDVLSQAAEGFDPFKDTRLTSFRKNLEQELKRAKDRIAARASAGDEFFGGGRRNEERELEEQGVRDIGSLAAQLEAESRQQAIGAALQLPNLASLQQEVPLDYLSRAMEFAEVPRGYEEQSRMANLQELMRQRGELQGVVNPAMQMSMYDPTLAYQLYGSTPGLFGGPSGIGMQDQGGVNRTVQAIQLGLLGAAGGGLGGAGAAGALGAMGGVGGGSLGSAGGLGSLFSMIGPLSSLFNTFGGQQQPGNMYGYNPTSGAGMRSAGG